MQVLLSFDRFFSSYRAMQDLELYRLTPLFWFSVSLSNRKNLIIEYEIKERVHVGESSYLPERIVKRERVKPVCQHLQVSRLARLGKDFRPTVLGRFLKHVSSMLGANFTERICAVLCQGVNELVCKE